MLNHILFDIILPMRSRRRKGYLLALRLIIGS
jgi:hypothetical protein